MSGLDEVRGALPAAAVDVKLNLEAVLQGEALTPAQRWGVAVAAADVVVVSAELELAAWDVSGRKLWSTFVEPPWEYDVDADIVRLDVMGRRTQFPLVGGPPSP
jgi:hypothetical protein